MIDNFPNIKKKYINCVFLFLWQAIAGIGPTIISIIVLFIFCQTWGLVVYPNLTTFPDWARPVPLNATL